ncbi:Uncharacterized protein Fot_40253 [Forsythia ovata]|uniref:Uncharacterized protein n=1 Tax=Forsythia ovata TaxID=205694 RepID=A0ABD1S732_9LAMI
MLMKSHRNWAIRDEPALNEQIPVNLHNILDYVIQVLKDIVSSMLMGVSFVPNEGEYHALFAGLECRGSPGYEHTQEAGELELSLFSKLVEEAGEQKVNENVDPYIEALDTYSNKALAEHYAHANGYVDFKAAFDTLGYEASYATTGDYCINAKTKIGFQTEEAAENKRKRPYDLLK